LLAIGGAVTGSRRAVQAAPPTTIATDGVGTQIKANMFKQCDEADCRLRRTRKIKRNQFLLKIHQSNQRQKWLDLASF
jgi:hypothetical protein